MNRREFMLLLLSGSALAQEGFQDFLTEELKEYKEERKGFKNYLEEVNREFREYRRITSEEFERFRSEVLRYWDNFETTDRERIVQYSKDRTVKRVFDFKKGELRLEWRGTVDKGSIRRELEEFLVQDELGLFNSDPFLSNVERRLRNLKHVRTGEIGREPVFTPILFGKTEVSREELREEVGRLMDKGKLERRETEKGKFSVFKVSFPQERILEKAKQYRPVVVRESERWRIDPPLVFSIIHTESYFNPLATSPTPAYGLMQIVPQSAGMEATRFLEGRPVLLAPSYLYDPENNVKVGTVYLHILYHRYFMDVQNPQSRLYCTICAYNVGPASVAAALAGTKNLRKTAQVVNTMSPEDVYRTLMRNLPRQEARDYLEKVSSRTQLYKNLHKEVKDEEVRSRWSSHRFWS